MEKFNVVYTWRLFVLLLAFTIQSVVSNLEPSAENTALSANVNATLNTTISMGLANVNQTTEGEKTTRYRRDVEPTTNVWTRRVRFRKRAFSENGTTTRKPSENQEMTISVAVLVVPLFAIVIITGAIVKVALWYRHEGHSEPSMATLRDTIETSEHNRIRDQRQDADVEGRKVATNCSQLSKTSTPVNELAKPESSEGNVQYWFEQNGGPQTEEIKSPSLQLSTLDISHGTFSRNIIGPAGGEIQVCEIKLAIPPRALITDTEISLGLIWKPEYMPKLLSKQSILTPTIVCEPHGLSFHTPVILTTPHCARNLHTDWDATLMKSETIFCEYTQWKTLTTDDCDGVVKHDSCIQLSLRHFTLYTVIGESKENTVAAKSVRLVSFASPLELGRLFKIRVYCINDYKTEMENVRDTERDLGGHRLDAPVPLFVHDTGGNVCLEVEDVSEGWAVNTKKKQLGFEAIWHGLSPYCLILMEPQGIEGKSKIVCNIKVYQVDFLNQMQIITIAEETRSNILPAITTPPGTYSVFPYELRRKLIMILDPISSLGRDWHTVANFMDLDYTIVTWLESQNSPTEMLLRQWETENRTLSQFHEAVKNMERLDLAEEVEKLILHENDNSMETTRL